MGAVDNGLMKIPIPGKKPPADWKRAAKLVKRAPNTSCLVLDNFLKKSCPDFTSFEIDLKKYMNFTPVHCFYIIKG
jgi:hypothetical protein